jgi:hypothetical protein
VSDHDTREVAVCSRDVFYRRIDVDLPPLDSWGEVIWSRPRIDSDQLDIGVQH